MLQGRVIVFRDELFPRGGNDPVREKYGEIFNSGTLPYVHPDGSDGDFVRLLFLLHSFSLSQSLLSFLCL